MDPALRTQASPSFNASNAGRVTRTAVMDAPAPAAAKPVPDAAATLLKHFPAEVHAAFLRLRETGDPSAADTLVLAIVEDHAPRKGAKLNDSSRLIGDLDFESVTIAEMVFFIEDLLEVSVTNAEIMQVRTIGELRAFIRRKLASLGRSTAAPGA